MEQFLEKCSTRANREREKKRITLKSTRPKWFTGEFYQTFKDKITLIFNNSQKIAAE